MTNRWGNNGNSERLYFLELQKSLQMVIAAMMLKDTCFLGKKAMTNLDSVIKTRNNTLPTIVKAMVLPIVMYGCKSWTKNKAEGQRINAFELWC